MLSFWLVEMFWFGYSWFVLSYQFFEGLKECKSIGYQEGLPRKSNESAVWTMRGRK